MNTQAQRLHAFEQYPGIERRERRSRRTQEFQYFIGQCLGAGNSAPQHPALAINEFRRRMHDEISTQVERALQDRRAETVIDRHSDAPCLGNRHQGRDVREFSQGI